MDVGHSCWFCSWFSGPHGRLVYVGVLVVGFRDVGKGFIMKECFIILLLASFSVPSYAYYYCHEPRPPSCPMFGGFESDFEFQMCKVEVEQYVQSMEDYAQCEQRRIRDEAREKVDEVIERFNCHARGGTFCG